MFYASCSSKHNKIKNVPQKQRPELQRKCVAYGFWLVVMCCTATFFDTVLNYLISLESTHCHIPFSCRMFVSVSFFVLGSDMFRGRLVPSPCVDRYVYDYKILEGMFKEHIEMVKHLVIQCAHALCSMSQCL